MALLAEEIRTGSVAYFDDKLLLCEDDIEHGDVHLDRSGPFLCVEVQENRSVWSPITTSDAQPDRLKFDQNWKKGGGPGWKNKDQYLNDGANTFLGPNPAFIRAAANEHPFKPHKRPYITPKGMEAVLAEIKKRGGRLLSSSSADKAGAEQQV